jgi:hypothetical protein
MRIIRNAFSRAAFSSALMEDSIKIQMNIIQNFTREILEIIIGALKNFRRTWRI